MKVRNTVRCCRCAYWLQSFEQKPEADHEFKNGHRCVEDVVVDDFVEVWKHQEDKGADDAPRGRNYTEHSQRLWNVARPQPKVCANSRGQSEKWQADIVIIEIRRDL